MTKSTHKLYLKTADTPEKEQKYAQEKYSN